MLVLEKIVDKMSRAISQVSMWAILVITFILVIDIILRFSTESTSIKGTYEMTEMAMLIIIYLGLAVTQVDKDHIRVVMLIEKLPWRGRAVVEAVIFAFTAYLCFTLFYAGVLKLQEVISRGITTQVLYIPHWPFATCMMVGLGALSVVFAFDAVQAIIKSVKNEKPVNGMEKSEAEKVLEETREAMGS